MKPPPRLVPVLMGSLSLVAPGLASALAARMFWHLGKPGTVRASEQATHEKARRDHIVVNGKDVAVYVWGSGEPVVLLVHGWRSRASRFSPLVESMMAEGRTIVSFDAPGNGASSGSRTDVFEYARAIQLLGLRYGPFDAIIGHSFGVLAAFQALREGLAVGRLVSIAGVYSFEHVFDTFVRLIGLRPKGVLRLRQKIERSPYWEHPFAWGELLSEIGSAGSAPSLLVVHDRFDPVAEIKQAGLIAHGHPGAKHVVFTRGLGHNRILADPQVLKEVAEFVPAPRRTP